MTGMPDSETADLFCRAHRRGKITAMDASVPGMLKEQGTAIQREAVEASISPDTLKQAFADTLSALDDISTYKEKALPQMAQTIQDFRTIADEGERQLTRLEKGKSIGF